MSALSPRLTALDERILNELPPAGTTGVRASTIADRLRGVDPGELRAILRGFECLGYASQRGGWWTR